MSGFKIVSSSRRSSRSKPGRNGVVGPNGCGKSNLVEAAALGDGRGPRPRGLRGSGMDDVIFAGSGNRPARATWPKVVITLDKRGSQGAGCLQRWRPRLEISRPHSSGAKAGSIYRHQRAAKARARGRADPVSRTASTGAHSAGLRAPRPDRARSSGAKAAQTAACCWKRRRAISGLHSRRHEAELRLQAAGKPISPAWHDVIQQLEGQLSGLASPGAPGDALPATSSGRPSAKVEARLLLGRWSAALAAIDEAETELGEAVRRVTGPENGARGRTPRFAEVEASQALPDLRTRRSGSRGPPIIRISLFRTRSARCRRGARPVPISSRLGAQHRGDRSRSRPASAKRLSDASAAVERLSEERQSLDAASAGLLRSARRLPSKSLSKRPHNTRRT